MTDPRPPLTEGERRLLDALQRDDTEDIQSSFREAVLLPEVNLADRERFLEAVDEIFSRQEAVPSKPSFLETLKEKLREALSPPALALATATAVMGLVVGAAVNEPGPTFGFAEPRGASSPTRALFDETMGEVERLSAEARYDEARRVLVRARPRVRDGYLYTKLTIALVELEVAAGRLDRARDILEADPLADEIRSLRDRLEGEEGPHDDE